jgi:nucleoside-diphosphate-sugar epimerase
MMQIVVAGACTPLGQALLRAIVERRVLTNGIAVEAPVQRVLAVDRAQPGGLFVDPAVEYVRGNYEQPRFLARMMGTTTDSIFDLSALNAGVEAGPPDAVIPPDLDAALVNSLDSTRALLEACRFQTVAPKLVMASMLAARPSGGALAHSTIANCCAMCEILVDEYARRALVDARIVRLPDVAQMRLEESARALIDAHELARADKQAAQVVEIAVQP